MIEWYSDKELKISFSIMPHVCVKYVTPYSTDEEIKEIKKYPFINKNELDVELEDFKNNKTYSFTIPKDYSYDGASIPRIFWRLIGSNTDNKFLIAALIHDVLCENHNYINHDRAFSTKVFNALLKESKVNPVSRFFMKNSVACYQTLFCEWDENDG